MPLGVNLCFAVKRMPEPSRWAAFVRDELRVRHVQFTFDLLDPWWPAEQKARLIQRVVRAVDEHDLVLDSAFVGLAHYVPSGLLAPDPDERAIARAWWREAIIVAASLGARAVGGPLGTISEADAADPDARGSRYEELHDTIAELAGEAASAGLELLIEPTPIRREYPATIDDCQRLLRDLGRRDIDNVGLTLDTGHMLYQPLHGHDARPDEWIQGLGGHIRQIHLDNTDGHGDPHWGWPDPRGGFDVAAFARLLDNAGLADIPVMLEVYPRFEDDSATVRQLMVSSVEHCRPHFPARQEIADVTGR